MTEGEALGVIQKYWELVEEASRRLETTVEMLDFDSFGIQAYIRDGVTFCEHLSGEIFEEL